MAEQLLVNHRNLGEIRDLGRSANVTERGQQVVLHRWTQKDIGAEPLRTSLRLGNQISLTHPALADQKTFGTVAHRNTYAVIHVEAQRMRMGNLYLYVIAGAFQLFGAPLQALIDLAVLRQRRAIHRLRNAVQFGIAAMEQNQAVIGKYP